MKNFEEVRKDKDFNLETVSYEELFDALKYSIAHAIGKVEKTEIDLSNIELNTKHSKIVREYASDGNIYPRIYLHVHCKSNKWIGGVFCEFVITPFTINLIVSNNGVKFFSTKLMTYALTRFMKKRFPDSSYMKKREKFIEISEKLKKQREENFNILL